MTLQRVLAAQIDSGDGARRSLWAALAEPAPQLLFKHSPHCIVSMGARRRVLELSEALPGLPIYEVDVIHDRVTSNEAEARFEIRHESPQAILFVGGVPTWHGSHGAVTVEAILKELEARPLDVGPGPPSRS